MKGELAETFTLFRLCETFGKLPSQILDEDEGMMRRFLVLIDERDKEDRKARKKLERKAKRIRRR